MEPILALSLAANIAQFVELCFKIVHCAREINQSPSGITKDNSELQHIANVMRIVSLQLDPPSTGFQSNEERAMRQLASDCRDVSDEMEELLRKLIPNDPHSKRNKALFVFKNVSSHKERKRLEERLERCRDHLELQLNSKARSEMRESLMNLGSSTRKHVDVLRIIHDHVKELEQGVKVRCIGTDAQNELKSLLDLSQAQCEKVAHSHILKALWKPEMDLRFDEVVDAHHETFKWFYKQQCGKTSGIRGPHSEIQDIILAGERFMGWLSSERTLFHIAGKLGSGKSTLMKFLFNHAKTKNELCRWADQKSLVLVRFFFWRPGTKVQNSINGLFRSLLHDIVQSYPNFAAVAFPELWHDLITSPWQVKTEVHFNDQDVRSALLEIFHQQATFSKHAFCFFIDGLDEYRETAHEDYKVLIHKLKEWITGSNGSMKICVSSREYNVFNNAFPAHDRIRLQDLTRRDMSRYARDLLEDMKNGDQKDHLVRDIVQRSDGIFLWVALVVKILREYIEDDQDAADFDMVLQSLPDELEALFAHILSNIPTPTRKRTYQVFALMFEAKLQRIAGLPLLCCNFLSYYEKDKNFETGPEERHDMVNLKVLEARAEKRLNGWVKGLAEAKSFRGGPQWKYVAFTHRSVPEYLAKSVIRTEMGQFLDGFDQQHAFAQVYNRI